MALGGFGLGSAPIGGTTGHIAESSRIDAVLVAQLLADTALQAELPDGVFMDAAPAGATRFVLVSMLTPSLEDIPLMNRRGFEQSRYRITATALSTSGADVGAAALRIDELFDHPVFPVVVPGYAWVAIRREARVRDTAVDRVDPSVRWFVRGGDYGVMVTPRY